MNGFPRRVYLLDPKKLAPEVIAVAFAKTSRSPEPFDQIAADLSDSSSAQFHEKWVVGYGHASVAEHAVLHIAMENVSRLAVECIESNRLASFTEKSTRYQKCAPGAFLLPGEIAGGPLEASYRDTCEILLDTYLRSLESVARLARARYSRLEGETEPRWENRIRQQYVDVCRYLLPASVLANVGMTVNARALEHAIRKMLSHPLLEVQAIGTEVKEAALAETPTLVKYAEPNAYLQSLPAEVRGAAGGEPFAKTHSGEIPHVTLLHYDPESELHAMAAACVRFTSGSYTEAMEKIRSSTPEERSRLARAMLERRSGHDSPLREMEHITYTFEAVLDQGAYFEFKRHRMMTQTPGPLSCDLGYVTPRWMEKADFRGEYDRSMRKAAEAYSSLRDRLGTDAAGYVVPNGFLRRLIFTLNLREAYQFCELRTSPGAHPAVRVIARSVARQIQTAHPLLAGYMRLEESSECLSQEEDFFC